MARRCEQDTSIWIKESLVQFYSLLWRHPSPPPLLPDSKSGRPVSCLPRDNLWTASQALFFSFNLRENFPREQKRKWVCELCSELSCCCLLSLLQWSVCCHSSFLYIPLLQISLLVVRCVRCLALWWTWKTNAFWIDTEFSCTFYPLCSNTLFWMISKFLVCSSHIGANVFCCVSLLLDTTEPAAAQTACYEENARSVLMCVWFACHWTGRVWLFYSLNVGINTGDFMLQRTFDTFCQKFCQCENEWSLISMSNRLTNEMLFSTF